MAKVPEGFREVKVVVPEQCYQRLVEMRSDAPTRTFTSMLGPVVNAYSRGEIRPVFEQQVKK